MASPSCISQACPNHLDPPSPEHPSDILSQVSRSQIQLVKQADLFTFSIPWGWDSLVWRLLSVPNVIVPYPYFTCTDPKFDLCANLCLLFQKNYFQFDFYSDFDHGFESPSKSWVFIANTSLLVTSSWWHPLIFCFWISSLADKYLHNNKYIYPHVPYTLDAYDATIFV